MKKTYVLDIEEFPMFSTALVIHAEKTFHLRGTTLKDVLMKVGSAIENNEKDGHQAHGVER